MSATAPPRRLVSRKCDPSGPSLRQTPIGATPRLESPQARQSRTRSGSTSLAESSTSHRR